MFVSRKFVSSLLLGGVALAIAACAAAPPVPKDRFYRLATPIADKSLQAPLPGVLAVDRLRGNGLTQDQPVLAVKRDAPNEVSPFSYHHWIDNPTSMLQQSLTDYLRDSGVADKVATTNMRIRQDYVLAGRIDAMERVSGGDEGVTARLAIEFRIEDLNNDNLILLKDYVVETRAEGEDWPAVLKAFEASLASIYAALRDDIAQLSSS